MSAVGAKAAGNLFQKLILILEFAMMSAFTVSGRLDRQKIVENKVAFRPIGVIATRRKTSTEVSESRWLL